MVEAAYVYIWNTLVGAIAWDPTTLGAIFEFDPGFATKDWDLAPIKMPLGNIKRGERIYSFPELNTETYHGLPGLLADSLPDKFGTTVLNAWLVSQGRTLSSVNPVERLCYVGKRGMGALEFVPALPGAADTATKLEIEHLVNLAELVLNQRDEFTAKLKEGTEKGLTDIIKVGTSAGGARAKAIIAYNPLTKEVRSGQVAAPKGFSHWIIKFDGLEDASLGSPKGFGRIEMAYHKMAVDCEINMTECQLYEENGRAHFMTRRFDRVEGKGKLHVQSLCAIAHFDFSLISAYSYEQAFATMRQMRLSYQAADQLYRRMVFNVLARNCDDHTKNIAFTMTKKGEWSLAPAFDLTHSFNPEGLWTSRHNLSINGKREKITKDDLLSVGKEMNIRNSLTIIELVSQIVNNWKKYALETGVDHKQIQQISQTHLLP